MIKKNNSISEVKKKEFILEGNTKFTKLVKQVTEYPDNLTEDKIIRLIYWFGSRKQARLAKVSAKNTEEDLKFLKEVFFDWFGMENFDIYDSFKFRQAYNMLTVKFKSLLNFLKMRPAFITRDIYKALDNCGYKNVIRNVVWVVDKEGNLIPKSASASKQAPAPITMAESLLWEIQNVALDKIMLVIQSISEKDIKKANLGIKSKAIRDLFAMYHMSRLNNNKPNQALINLNVYNSSPEQKINAFVAYVNKNRETNR